MGVDSKSVVRAGYGMSYIHFNRLGGENLLSFNGPHVVGLNITQQITQPPCVGNQAPTTCFRTTQQGYPEGYTTPASFNPLNVRVNYIPKDTPTGNVQSWHASVQREILPNLLVDVGYVGNKSRDIMILDGLQPGPRQRSDREPVGPGAPSDSELLRDPDGVCGRQG